MILKLFQGDVVTSIRIETDKAISAVSNVITEERPSKAPIAVVKRSQTAVIPKRNHAARLTETQVKEIRNNWEVTVKACGSKNAAADQLAKVYDCSAKNIYAIIYRYSWANV